MLMAPLARAGSIAALAVLLVLALVPAWNGPWSALRHAAGGPELGGVRAGPDLTPMDALSASVTADPPAADLGQSITFTCTASGGTSPYVYTWTLGDSEIGAGPTVSHTYGSTGTYTATCTVTDLLLSIATDSKNVVISPNPSVTASVHHNLAAPGKTLRSDPASSGGDGFPGGAQLLGGRELFALRHGLGFPRRQQGGTDPGRHRGIAARAARRQREFTTDCGGCWTVDHVHLHRVRRDRPVYVWLDLRRRQFRERVRREPRLPSERGHGRDVYRHRRDIGERDGLDIRGDQPRALRDRVRGPPGRRARLDHHVHGLGQRRTRDLHRVRLVVRRWDDGFRSPNHPHVHADRSVPDDGRRHGRERRDDLR